MAKHTPGPNGCGCEWGYGQMCSLHEAAPDLLEALRGIVTADFESVPRTAVYRAVKILQDEARAAIAKAEGE